MNDQRVTIDIQNGIADVRLTRPDKMNALDPAMFEALTETIAELGAKPGLRCVVLSGEGRAFCAGLDMATMSGNLGSGLDIHARTFGDANLFQQVAWGWRTLPVPVIAAVHGIAFGGGFQIMSGADIRVLAPQTRCSIMEIKWGIVPDMAGFALWRTLVRDDVLRELAYTAREFTAEEAVEKGFATYIAEDPHARAMEIAQAIAGRNPQAVRAIKRITNMSADAQAEAILMAESVEQAKLLRTPNQMEAVMANMQKRAPNFADD